MPDFELRRVGNRSPEIFPMYFSICGGVQLQLRRGSLRYPQGQGLAAATNMKSAGKDFTTFAIDAGVHRDSLVRGSVDNGLQRR
jgi:hypothetical protein